MQDITQLETMAMLDLPQNERNLLERRINALMASFSPLRDVDAEGVEPLTSALDLINVMREDTAIKSISRDEILANAPAQHDGFFQVPGTLG